ncbi:MAG: hypothetical protein DI529_02140 [Chryseobacterium sp.]|nr:MAG: hypothetical protein DI529_02140 [Chryseobacterium sp.]
MRFLFLILFFLNCTSGGEKQSQKNEIKDSSIENIAILIDSSITMTSPDFEPNRFTVTINTIRKIIENKKENQSFSIVFFSGNSYLACSLTEKKENLLALLNENSEKLIHKFAFQLRSGTNIPDGILNGIYSLKSAKSGTKSILIFSDGPTNVHSFPINAVKDQLLKDNITLNSIIISPKDFELSPTGTDEFGKIIFKKVRVKPFDKELSELSKSTNGFNKIFQTNIDFDSFDFQKIEKSDIFNNKKSKAISQNMSEKNEKIYQVIRKRNDSLKNVFEQK